MSFRAVVLGLLLALFISIATYFNDWIIGQTQLIGNFLPISVFGLAVFVLLALNPALFSFGERAPLRGGEVALITALGLVACGWPGSNFYRTFTHVSALPSHWLKTKANWQSTHVMSYVPGASAELGQGHVRDWKALTRALVAAESMGPLGQVWLSLSPEGKRAFSEAGRTGVDAGKLSDLTVALNAALKAPGFYRPEAFRSLSKPEDLKRLLERSEKSLAPHELVRRNRLLLVATLPGLVLPPPEGEGVLFDGGRADAFAVDTLLQGRSESAQLGVRQLPWSKWWPTLKLWVGAALAFALASLCMALIVHPQWSKRELLPYPIARFLEEAAERKPGSRLPEIARSKLFWLGASALVVLHLVNGLHAWYDWVPEIPRQYDLWPLGQLFPNAVRVWGQWGYFGPTFYVSVIAFSFFMSTSVSFSLGIAQVLYMAFGAFLLSHGIQLEASGIEGKASNLLRFGAYFSVALVIVYTGRRYYANVLKSAFGGVREKDTPGYATWAARGFVVSVVLAIAVVKSAGLSLWIAAAFVALELVLILVMTRIVTETGSFFMQASWTPVGVLTALFGFETIGPTTYIVLCMASVMMFIDSRELLMPYLSNALKLGDRHDGAPPRRLWPWFAGVVVAGGAIAGVVTLYLQYNHSVTQKGNEWATNTLPTYAFDALAQAINKASAEGTLSSATALSGLSSLSAFRPDPSAFTWLGLGLVFALVAAVARLRLPWWPLHPVAFLVWGTYPIVMFGPSFLIGWIVKAAVIGTTGAKGYHTFRPLMIGVIAGELLMGLVWMIVGVVYYFAVGKAPVMYNIFRVDAMTTQSSLHEIAWLGLTLKVPEDWEIVRHSVSVQRGSLIFVDRRRQRLELGWLAVKAEPDLEHWARDLEKEERRTHTEARLRRRDFKGGWRALERKQADGEIMTRAVRYEPSTRQLIEAAIETRAGVSDDRELVEALLERISVANTPERARYFRAFDVDVQVPALRLGGARVKPADVCFDFVGYDAERERELTCAASVERLGMVESWYNGDAKALIQSRNPGSRFSSFSSTGYAGHEAILAEGIEPGPIAKRALGLLRERRVLVFRCELKNALYALSTTSRKGERIEPQALEVQCCGGAS